MEDLGDEGSISMSAVFAICSAAAAKIGTQINLGAIFFDPKLRLALSRESAITFDLTFTIPFEYGMKIFRVVVGDAGKEGSQPVYGGFRVPISFSVWGNKRIF